MDGSSAPHPERTAALFRQTWSSVFLLKTFTLRGWLVLNDKLAIVH
jgi:hypothetical protein